MKRLFSLLLLVLMGLFICREAVAKLDPESHAILSDPGYAKHIEVQCYLVTREQLAEFFSKKKDTIAQLSNNQLPLDDVYLLVRCKNNGDYMSFGVLKCFIPNRGDPILIEVGFMKGGMKSYNDSAIHVDYGVSRNNIDFPQVNYEWDCLYTM